MHLQHSISKIHDLQHSQIKFITQNTLERKFMKICTPQKRNCIIKGTIVSRDSFCHLPFVCPDEHESEAELNVESLHAPSVGHCLQGRARGCGWGQWRPWSKANDSEDEGVSRLLAVHNATEQHSVPSPPPNDDWSDDVGHTPVNQHNALE